MTKIDGYHWGQWIEAYTTTPNQELANELFNRKFQRLLEN